MATILVILLLIVGGIALWKPTAPTTTLPVQKTEQPEHNEQNNSNADATNEEAANTDTENNTDNSTETLTDHLASMITESIQKAIGMFSSQETHVTAIGDSLTQGVGDETGLGGYVGILERTTNPEDSTYTVTFDNFGKRGNRSDQLLKRLEQEDIQASIADADIVLITIGANDVMQVVKQNITNLTIEPFNKARRDYRQRLNQIISKIITINSDVDVYLLGFYNPFEQYFDDVKELETIIADWNETLRQVTLKFDSTTFIPINDLFSASNEDLFADDHFHPNYRGYKRMADRVLEYTGQKR